MIDIQILNSIDEVDAKQWNALVTDNNPFSRHEFLSALENNHCVGEKFGWIPRHIAILDNQQLIGGAILYEKYNNYGEFVFDHAWHNAYERHGLAYYPKLVSAIPYTPASGNRILFQKNHQKLVFSSIFDAICKICEKSQISSWHCLFANANEQDILKQYDLSSRIDCQFHWNNQNYGNFDDFLANLRKKKRKNIRQERKRIAQSDVEIRQLDGNSATAIDWQNFANFYQQTFLEKSGTPTLNLGFFQQIAKTMPNQVLLFLADLDGECVAGSLMFKSDTRLYGRHWGCAEQVDFLHFELCYYQGIDYAIKHKLQVFEPGAQGEHKVSRGFVPTQTQSLHFIQDSGFKKPIDDFCNLEKSHIKAYMQDVNQHNPYLQQS